MLPNKNISWRPKGTFNALHLAASNGDLPSLRIYISYSKLDSDDDKLSLSANRESKLDIATKNGDTAFHIALRKGHGKAARELAQAGCNVLALGSRGESALHMAASSGMIEELEWLISTYPGLDLHTSRSLETGRYVQHYAAAEDRCDTLRYLHSHKVRFDLVDFEGETCFHVACRLGNVGALLYLAERDFTLCKMVNVHGKDGETLAREANRLEAAERISFLFKSKKREKKSVIEFQRLLSTGADLERVKQFFASESNLNLESLVDTWNLKNGTNAFLEACVGGQVPVVEFLLRQVPGNRVLVNCKNGTSALQIASAKNNARLVAFLLEELEMDPSRVDANGANALLVAERNSPVFHMLTEFAESRRRAISPGILPSSQASSDESVPPPAAATSTNGVCGEDKSVLLSDEVRQILLRVGLSPQWMTRFAEEGFVSINNLSHLLEGDLLEMKMPKGFRRTLLTEVEQLKRAAPVLLTSPATPPPFTLTTSSSSGHQRIRVPVAHLDKFLSDKNIPLILHIELLLDIHRSVFVHKRGNAVTCDCEETKPCQHEELFRKASARPPPLPAVPETISIPDHFHIKFNEFQMEHVIGEGSYGIVRLAMWRGMRVAVKELKNVQHTHLLELKREASMMARVSNHDHVVPLVGMMLEPIPSVVMAYMCGGSVEDLLLGPRALPTKLAWFAQLKLIKDAACGVLHLHCQHVIHRDLAARNLLVDLNGTVRVADFGFARIKEEHLSKGYTQTHVGPIKWMAPEAIRQHKFSEKSDVFGFGVTIYEILARERPWAMKESMDVVVRVCSGERMSTRHITFEDREIPDLLAQCWLQEAEKRPSMSSVLEIVDRAWKQAGGEIALDRTGGVADYVRNHAMALYTPPPSRTLDSKGYVDFQS